MSARRELLDQINESVAEIRELLRKLVDADEYAAPTAPHILDPRIAALVDRTTPTPEVLAELEREDPRFPAFERGRLTEWTDVSPRHRAPGPAITVARP